MERRQRRELGCVHILRGELTWPFGAYLEEVSLALTFFGAWKRGLVLRLRKVAWTSVRLMMRRRVVIEVVVVAVERSKLQRWQQRR